MALKVTVTATEFAALAEAVKAEYKAQLDGSYKLDLGGLYTTDKDPSALHNALEGERAEKAKIKAKLDAVELERDEARKAKERAEAVATGNKEELEKVFQKQSEEMRKSFEKQLQDEKNERIKSQQAIANENAKVEAKKIATELFGSQADLVLPHIEKMIVGKAGDVPSLEFRTADGQPDITGKGLQGVKDFFLTNPIFSGMVVASKASGSSANGSGGSLSRQKSDGSTKKYNDYNSAEKVALRKNNPTEYDRLLKEHRESAKS